jgi:glycosyltransferase involved in cell wall biosynthesis
MKINICIPVYNEEENLPQFILKLNKYIENFQYKEINLEVIFYNDGSNDKSLDILNGTKYTILSELNNKGLGYAINKLFSYSKDINADGVVKLDCDGQMDINEIDLFIDVIRTKEVDLIQGNRFNVSNDFKFGLIKKIGMRIFSIIFRIIGVSVIDSTNGFIYVSKKWLQDYKIVSNYNAAQQILLDTKLRNLTIQEIDVHITNRTRGKSFIGIKYPINVFASMFALYAYRKTTKLLIKPGFFVLISALFLLLNDIFLWIKGIEEKVISNNIVLLLFFIGIQLMSIGLIIEFIKKQKII